jgi:hypothetical protein
MFGLLGTILGFASSAVPAITDSFARKQDNELRASGYDHDLKMYETMGADNEHDRLIQHDISINQGVGFIAGLQKSVRPVITYAFFLLFATIEITLLLEALKTGIDFAEAIQVLWDDETKGIFAAILAFWFGSRAIDKARKV